MNEVGILSAYPLLEIDTQVIAQNARILREICLKQGIETTAVIKGFNAQEHITAAVVSAGFRRVASSRLPHLQAVRERGLDVETMALRLPMLSELPELLRYADISLNSEEQTLRALDEEAARQGLVHGVILMRDVGDLREGLIDSDALVRLALLVEQELPGLKLRGVGTNLSCYGSVIPTAENLSLLARDSRRIEQVIGRGLEIVSGGSTSSLPLIIKGGMPPGISDLRVGEALVAPCDLLGYWGCKVPGLSNAGLILKAQIIEIGEKPTMPIGLRGPDAFGDHRQYEDRGIRRRALLALGVSDVGDYDKLLPIDPDIVVLGGSSDHLVVDIHDSRRDYALGGIIAFELSYKAMLFSTATPMVTKTRLR